MKHRLLWKLLFSNIVPVIGVIILVVWLAIDKLAANYFMALMKKYDVSPTDIHHMFLTSIHTYLIWATAAALCLAIVLSYLLTRRVLRPLSQMATVTREVAAGNYAARAEIVTRDEVGDLGLAFNRMADSLEKVERLRKTMVADVSHELRTPLTNLRGYLEALNDGVLPPSPETFRMLQAEILRLVHLVEDLQQLARADAARAYLDRRRFSLTEALRQMLELYRQNFADKNITVQTSFAPEAEQVTADRDKLLQAVRNLFENSWKYTPPGGRVRVTTERSVEGIRIQFANTGAAILPQDLPYIFERFFKADRSRSRETGGAGIGLSIVKELVEAHGGHVGADSSATETRVWFVLPS
jgi:two-component system, OmpR family, sensor histidine kinase BaeS